jgi:hypothetical protein
MAAGLGFKTFTTGEVLTAGDVNGYLMQGVLVFASAAARNSAITSPQEGQFAYTKDTNSLWYYDGAAWVASGATGDIEGVTAGVGITGGGTSGTVTITNDMATTITAAGDIVVGTGSGTYDNLPIGTTNQILTADTTVSPYKVKWASPAGGGKVLQVVQGTLTSTFSTTSSSYVDTGLTVTITPSSATSKVYVTYSGNTAATITGSATNNYGLLRLMADATAVQGLNVGYYALASSTNPEAYIPTALSLLHSPATTSAVTYKIQIRVAAATNFKIFASSGETASIVAMEIGA